MDTGAGKLEFVARNELKYVLDYSVAVKLRSALSTMLCLEEHCKGGPYRVRSLYYDTYSDTDYFEKLQGEEVRKKLRLRIYNESDDMAKMELKAKNGNFQNKYSLIVSRAEAGSLIQGDYAFLLERNDQAAGLIYENLVLGGYRPKAVIEYDRLAYVYPLNSTRITFDEKVRAEATDFNIYKKDLPLVVLNPSLVVLEVKYNGQLADSIKRVLAGFNLNQQSFSKYGSGRALTGEYI